MTKQFTNEARMTDESGQGKIKRYVHQPLTIEHYGTHASIQSNGRVILRAVDKAASTKEEIVYDEIDVPASLIFKLANLLKATRNIEYVSVTGTAQEKPSIQLKATEQEEGEVE